MRPDVVLTKAVLNAAELLDLSKASVGRILGVSQASIWRLVSGKRTVDPHSKEGEFALLLVRVCRSLDALVGSDARQRKCWMHSTHRTLNGRPAELLTRADGLVGVVKYLESMHTTEAS